ncbi:MAG: hypothetical protein M1122_01965 [Candidatus Marsarchaeota archaeon]|jgi:hypothetical protein|nr:hypothetical protein [Candidatus Marsarchaeota archaeon]
MDKIASSVRKYIKSKPYLMEALGRGIVNLSSLARMVDSELHTRKLHAIKAALRRYAIELGKGREESYKQILSVLKYSRTTVIDGVSVIISNKDITLEAMANIRVGSNYVYISNTENKDILRKEKEHIIKHYSDKSALVIHSEEDIEKVRGVVAYLTSLLAQQKINTFEFVSCYTETIIVTNRPDAVMIFNMLSDIINTG